MHTKLVSNYSENNVWDHTVY